MAGSLNRVQLIGHLGKDPESRRTQSGAPVVTFRLATSETWKDKTSGERREATEWHTVVVFNEALCGVVEQYARKGSKLFVEGQLKTRKWQDQAGQDRYSTEIVLQSFGSQIILLDKAERGAPEPDGYGSQRTRSDEYAGARSGNARPAARQAPAPDAGAIRGDLDDDIPF